MATAIEQRLNDFYRKLGSVTPPESITQSVFETDQFHLERLAALRAGERANVWDLADYMDDMLYREVDSSLLVHVLPSCLREWHEYVRSENFECPGFGELFYTLLTRKDSFAGIITNDQRQALWEFMRESILEEIDAQAELRFEGSHAAPYRWFKALMTHGVIASDIEHLWMDWWSVSTIGRAIAAVQYISCLVYPKNSNPVFAPYTQARGGGPPCLWEFDGYSDECKWKIQNVEFLQRLLSDPKFVISIVRQAVDRLSHHRGCLTAQQLLADLESTTVNRKLRSSAETLSERISALPDILATGGEPGTTYLWPD